MMIFIRLLVFSLGTAGIYATILSAIKTFVLPRSSNTLITRTVFRSILLLFRARLRLARHPGYDTQDRIMALFAPLAVLALPIVWVLLVQLSFTPLYWALGGVSLSEAFILSGSSLLTLGFAVPAQMGSYVLAFVEATIGLGLVALVIAYLPTMYTAFSRRETLVAMLEVRAGDPASAITLIERYHRLRGIHDMGEMFTDWETWFSELEESHTSLAPLSFFRSPKPNRSWITAAGAVLDGAALYSSAIDVPRDPRPQLCIRAGFLALRHIADFFGINYDPNPRPEDPISISRYEFDEAYDRLAAQGVPLKADRDQAWRDFAGWRVNYDTILLALARLTMAPYAPWVSDRSPLGSQGWHRQLDVRSLWRKRLRREVTIKD